MEAVALASFRIDEASKICLATGLLELLLDPARPGVVDDPLRSPVVMRINSDVIPSS
jgi:hypothetical protein